MGRNSYVSDPALKSYLGAFDAMSDGILFVSASGEIQLANDPVLTHLGYSGDEFSNTSYFRVNPHLALIQWKKTWKMLVSGESIREETEFMHTSGILFPVLTETSIFRLGAGEWAMVSIQFLLETNRYHHLLNVATDQIRFCSWELNLVSKKLSIFGATEEILGLSNNRAEFETQEIKSIFRAHLSEKDFEKLENGVQEIIENGDSFEADVIFNREDGSFNHLHIFAKAQKGTVHTTRIYGTIHLAFHPDEGEETKFLSKFTLDHVSDLIFWVREDGSFAYVNKAVCKRLGYSRKELLRMDSKEVTLNFDQARRNELWENLRREKHLAGKYNLITKSGQIVTVLSSSNYLVYEGEEYNCSFSKDITSQETETRQLKLTQFSVEKSHEMIVWTDATGKIVYSNQAFLEKTGYNIEESNELTLQDILVDEGFVSRHGQWHKQLSEEEDYLEVEAELVKKSKSSIPVYCSFNYLHFEDQEFICIYMRDWSKKKKRDVQLFLAQNALDTAKDMIFWIDQNLKINYKNVAARNKLGYEKGELRGGDFKKVCPDLDLETVIYTQVTGQIEAEFFTKKGKKIPVEISFNPAQFGGARFQCMIVRDITERKRNEEKIREKQEKIEELSLKLKDENILLKEEISSNYNFNNIVTQNKEYRKVLAQVAQVADTDATVLIQGETGTGKELLARAIYSLSDREDRAFIKVNCAALPENLIESELFGHEKGAFTGAIQQKKGRFELADKGTIFLDEIGELSLDLQAKLLRVLQEGEFERLGGTTTLKVDIRIVAATNRNLEEMVEKGTFREDLFYRLNVFPISSPPLRDRKEDIPLLVNHFVNKYGKRMGKTVKKISKADISELQKYSFPGNIRELENIVERGMILAKDGVLNLKASFDLVKDQERVLNKNKLDFPTFEEIQKEHIIAALKKSGMRVTGPKGAARLLDLNDRTLMSKMRKLGIKREDFL